MLEVLLGRVTVVDVDQGVDQTTGVADAPHQVYLQKRANKSADIFSFVLRACSSEGKPSVVVARTFTTLPG